MLVGHVGQDPEVKQLDGGRTLATFSLATSRKHKDTKTGEMKTDTQWHNMEAWGKNAETISQYVKKGQLLETLGEIRYGKYEAKDGTTRHTTNIMVKEFTMLGSKPEPKSEEPAAAESVREYKETAAPAAKAQATVSASGADIVDNDDLPF